jgi:hypothetical protein
MNQLYVGFAKEISLPKGGFLLIDDELWNIPRSRVFDPLEHSFNPIKNINYRSACDFVEIIDALFSRGENTLTKDTGLDFLHDALEAAPKTLEGLIAPPDKKSSTGHVWAYSKIRRVLRSHVLFRVLCNPTNFSFNPNSKIQARINRAELGDFDALVLGLLLMSFYEGQLVIPDLGFYGRELHTGLVRQGRLIAGVQHLSELPTKLRGAALLIEEKIPQGTNYEDAKVLAHYARLVDGTNEFHDYVQQCMG